jgi:multisubunit Na+/H+ antiporter MnhC subunit
MTTIETAVKRESVREVRISKWSNRFIWAAIIEGLAAVVLTIPIVWPVGLLGLSITPAVAQVIAGGSAGTWFLVGYAMFITVGVVAVGLTALFYHHFEVNLNKPYRGVSNAFAWVHLVAMTVGASAATFMLMYAGYFGEKGLMPTSEGGLGLNAGQVHVQILSQFVDPVGYALILTGIGVLAGGVGFLINYIQRR